MMLTISREAPVKIGKHAWGVYPLEAFGYLLGRTTEGLVYAALPCSKTCRWDDYADRWLGIEDHLEQAWAVGAAFDLDVVGFYASTESNHSDYPIPTAIINPNQIVLVYGCLCCPQCSEFGVKYHDRWLRRREEFTVCSGKRITSVVNQKRILKKWSVLHGPIDYSNGAQDLLLAGIPLRRKP